MCCFMKQRLREDGGSKCCHCIPAYICVTFVSCLYFTSMLLGLQSYKKVQTVASITVLLPIIWQSFGQDTRYIRNFNYLVQWIVLVFLVIFTVASLLAIDMLDLSQLLCDDQEFLSYWNGIIKSKESYAGDDCSAIIRNYLLCGILISSLIVLSLQILVLEIFRAFRNEVSEEKRRPVLY